MRPAAGKRAWGLRRCCALLPVCFLVLYLSFLYARGRHAGAASALPQLILSEDEKQWFDPSLTNTQTRALPLRGVSAVHPLASLPFSPGIPSLAAYNRATASGTFRAMERFSAAFLRANDDLVRQYIWSADPLHAWSRKYEYVWHAEAVRAALPPARAAAVAATWPDQAAAPAPQEAPFLVLDAGSGFTFLISSWAAAWV